MDAQLASTDVALVGMTRYDRVVKITVSVANDLYREAEEMAAERGVSRSQLYAEALAAYLRNRTDDQVTRDIDAALGEESNDDDGLAAWTDAAARRST